MKKLFIYLFVAAGYTSYTAQSSDSWVTIDPGYNLEYGSTRLIVKQNSIYLFNSNHSTLLRSSNGGNSWSSVSISSDSSHHEYTDMYFVNDQVGYLAGYDGSMFTRYGLTSVIKKTTDGGLTWQKISNGILHNSILTNISFFDQSNGLAFGTANMQTVRFITDDGGQNWTPLQNFGPDMDQVNSTHVVNGQKGFAAGIGHYMHIAVTADGGSTWETKHFHGSSSVNGLKFFDAQNGIVVANDSIFGTYDGANSFAFKTKFPYAPAIKSFDMIDMLHGFFCADHEIYYTADGGATWSLSYSNPGLQLVSLKIEGARVFATTCGSNTILKLDISDRLVGLSKNTRSSGLVNLYPNPASDRFYVAAPEGEQLVSSTIIDQLGRIVKRQSLKDTRAVDVNELSKGVYMVEITTSSHTYQNKLIIQQK